MRQSPIPKRDYSEQPVYKNPTVYGQFTSAQDAELAAVFALVGIRAAAIRSAATGTYRPMYVGIDLWSPYEHLPAMVTSLPPEAKAMIYLRWRQIYNDPSLTWEVTS